MSDDQWARLEPLLPRGKKAGRLPKWTKRQLIDGIRWPTPCWTLWRDVPEYYGHWRTVYGLFRRWQRAGRDSTNRQRHIPRSPARSRDQQSRASAATRDVPFDHHVDSGMLLLGCHGTDGAAISSERVSSSAWSSRSMGTADDSRGVAPGRPSRR
nr:transposase [Nocardia arthritidis]